MTSSFFGIEMGKRSLQQFKTALEVTGNNINNVATKGYSKQRVVMSSFDKPLSDASLNRAERPGQLGQGGEITRIERVRDGFIDSRIGVELGTGSYWNTRFEYLNQVESIYNEPSNLNLRGDLDAFWNGWQELADNPTERASRYVVVERAERINSTLNQMYGQMNGLRNNLDNVINAKIKRVNEISETIKTLNVEIVKQEALGQSPNDYLDRRDLLIDELSTLADITVKSADPDETIIYIGSRHLIQGGLVSPLEAVRNTENQGMTDVYWGIDDVKTVFKGGEIKALLELRDGDLVEAINDLDAFAINLSDAVNEIHRDGFGINQETNIDFFTMTPLTNNANGNYDLDQDGNVDTTMLFKVSGTNKIDVNEVIGTSGTLTFGSIAREGENITIDYTDGMKVQDLIDKINSSEGNVSAYVDHRSRLVFKARGFDDFLAPNYYIKHVEDSGEFLTGITGMLNTSGADGAYSWNQTNQVDQLEGDGRSYSVSPYRHPAEAIKVADIIKSDTNYVAASGGIDTVGEGSLTKWNGIGDGSNAISVANLRFKEMMVNTKSTFNDFYTGSIARVATRAETANTESKKQDIVVDYLESLRQSISGVNLDEEMAQMVMYQHGYNASARIVSMMDQLLDTIINRMGV